MFGGRIGASFHAIQRESGFDGFGKGLAIAMRISALFWMSVATVVALILR